MLLQWGQDLGGHREQERLWGGTGSPEQGPPGAQGITWAIPEPGGLRGSPSTAALHGTWRWRMPVHPPPTCPDSNLWLGVLPVPGALRCPPAPPCHTVGRGKTGSPVPSLWPRAGQECAEAAGSCQEEPGSTRPRIACELIATSRRSLQHPRACRGAQPWDPPCRAPSSQFYAPAGLRAYAGTSPGMGVPGQPQHGGHRKPWGRAGLGPAVEPVTHSCLDVLELNYPSVRPGAPLSPPQGRCWQGRRAGWCWVPLPALPLLLGAAGGGQRGGSGGLSHPWDLPALTRSSGGTVSRCSA